MPVFDIYAYLDLFCARQGFDRDELFLDVKHVHRLFGHFIGTEIVDFLARLDRGALRRHRPGLWFRRLRFVPFEELQVFGASHETEESSSLITRRLLHVEPGGTILCRPRSRSELIGLSYNAARSWGRLQDCATGIDLAHTLYRGLYTLSRPLTMVGWPIRRKRRSDGEAFALRYDYMPPGGPDRPPPGMQIHGLVLRDLVARHALTVLGEAGQGTRIEGDVSEARETEMAAVLRRVITRLQAEQGWACPSG